MKVIRPVSILGSLPLSIPGELIANKEHVVFVPDENPYGPHRLLVHEPKISICGTDDDDCISVSGWTEVSHPKDKQIALWRKVIIGFYPMARTP